MVDLWEARYCTGITVIDLQHRVLAGLTTSLRDLAKDLDRQRIASALERVVGYARFHFEYEERLLQLWSYDDISAHRREHERLLAEFGAIASEVAANRLPLDKKVMSFLEGWVFGHIVAADFRWVPFAKEPIGVTGDSSLSGGPQQSGFAIFRHEIWSGLQQESGTAAASRDNRPET